jgi:putative transposase
MTKTRRKWSEAQKLHIIQEVEQIGFTETLRKYNLAQTLLNRWMQFYASEGIKGLQPKYRTIDPAVRQLEQENERLKRIIAKQALEIDFKDELLKKNH